MKKITAVLFSLIFLICQCGLGPKELVGGTTNTPNACVSGILVHKDGSAAQNAVVYCIPADFIPGISDKNLVRDVITNDSGVYTFSSLDSGVYTITAVDRARATRCLIQETTTVYDTVVIQKRILDIPGTIKIAITNKEMLLSGYFYIPGTTLKSGQNIGNTSDYVVIDSVPDSKISSVNYVSVSDTQYTKIRTNIEVISADTTIINNSMWKYTKTILLNTSSTGAGVSGTVVNFPVLVRLTNDKFDFSAIQSDGKDIMFTKADNTILSHEFELWDPVNGLADIWVKVDTIYGNNDSQFITMYYGNTKVHNKTEKSVVFDTSNKFMGVWHLGESVSSVYDATNHNYTGTRYGSLLQSEGKIGKGTFFKDSTAYCEFGDILNPGNASFTVSIWCKRTGLGLQALVAKTNGGFPSASYGWHFGFNLSDQFQCTIASGGINWGDSGTFSFYSMLKFIDTTSWHHLAVIFDRTSNSNCRLYVDGMSLPFITIGDIRTVGALNNNSPFRIGKEADGKNTYKGTLDECEISYTIRSQDWIKLCFMNQREDNKLLIIK